MTTITQVAINDNDNSFLYKIILSHYGNHRIAFETEDIFLNKLYVVLLDSYQIWKNQNTILTQGIQGNNIKYTQQSQLQSNTITNLKQINNRPAIQSVSTQDDDQQKILAMEYYPNINKRLINSLQDLFIHFGDIEEIVQ